MDEENNTPGFCYLFRHLNVPNPMDKYVLHFRGTYGGDDSHIVKVQVYNWDTTSYMDIFTIPNSTFTQDYYRNLPFTDSIFDPSGTLQFRIIHISAGNDGHLLRINYWRIYQGSSSSSSSSRSSSSSSSSSSS